MGWYPNVIFYIGMFDAGVLMLGGLASGLVIMMGWDAAKLWERVWPATAIMIATNVGAALLLAAVKWLIA